MVLGRIVFLACALALTVASAGDDLGFYSEYRSWVRTTRSGPITFDDATLSKYGELLRGQGVAQAEIERRLRLLRTTPRQQLENDFWGRYFQSGTADFNREPNAFLVSAARGRRPGTALDLGAGQGRNAVWLARQGWQVTAVEPSEGALAEMRKNAESAEVKLHIVRATDEEFDYGREKWDLILFSWTNPRATAAKVVEGLKPGGILVVEGAQAWWGDNGLPKLFPTLKTVQHEETLAKSDYFARREMRVARYLGQKGQR